METSDISRFWSRVSRGPQDQCWNWTAGISSSGYGAFYIEGKQTGAHRMAALITSGPSDDYVLHSCDNKLCCNPRHLRYGTQGENLQDMRDKGRWKRIKPQPKGYQNHLRGAEVWSATLTEPTVRQIWDLHLQGKNASEISNITAASRCAINSLCQGKTWRHLTDAPSIKRLAKGGIRRSKLTPENIETARRLISEGLTNKEIGAMLGTSPTPISNLRNYGTTWRPKP